MKRMTLLILCGVMVFALAGCASNTAGALPTPSPMTPTIMPSNTMTPLETMMPGATGTPDGTLMPGATGTPDGTLAPETTGTMSTEEAKVAAQRVSDEVAKLSEVEKATAVVMGNTALVGVDFASQYKGQMTTRIKDMVSERAKKAAPAIQNVAVTADPDLISRIRAMLTRVQEGGEASAIGTEFSEIVNRITPV